ncbi:MAG TPA: ABC transporter ATP-binding protein [Anaerolineaceae bacterium]|jgi:putative ABC transport system ATP-binding protein
MTDPRLKNILAHSEETITKTIPEKQSEPIIRVDKASRVYQVGTNNVNALREISIEIPKGVLAALKGRSGSGKTTLLNLIGGLDKPTSGTVSLFGEPLFKMTGDQLTDFRRHRIGFVFQSFAIMPLFSALENVELMLRIAGYNQNRRQAAMRALDIVGLGPWANHRPWELSGGQQQRVAIARALATHPDLILADEPTGELDSSTGRQIMALFRYIVAKEGITVVMATHDSMIEEYAHIVYELGDGQIIDIRYPNGL